MEALIDSLTDKRAEGLNVNQLKQVKAFARASDANVAIVFQHLWSRLNENNAQVRLLALLACHELFKRSKHFRALLTARMQNFVDLVVGVKANAQLPRPKESAEALRARAIELIQEWDREFGGFYSQLGIACRYLRDVLKQDIASDAGSLSSRPPRPTASETAAQARADLEARCRAILDARASALDDMALCLQYGETTWSILIDADPDAHPRAAVAPASESPSTGLTTSAAGAYASAQPAVGASDRSGRSARVGSSSGGVADGDAADVRAADDAAALRVDDQLGGEGFEFEDVEAAPRGEGSDDDGAAMVMAGFEAVERAAASEGPELSEECRQTLVEALSESYRSIQRIYLPKLSSWTSDLRRLAALPPAATPGGAAASAASSSALLPERVLDALSALTSMHDELAAFCVKLQASEALFEQLQQLAARPRPRPATPAQAAPAPVRRERGRNDRLRVDAAPAAVPNIYAALRDADPAAPRAGNPYTISVEAARAPGAAASTFGTPSSAERVDRSPAAAAKAAAMGGASDATARDGRGGGRGGNGGRPPTMPRELIKQIASRAPVLPPGDYLKLWESREAQLEHVKQHMQTGQIYSHWGPVSDDIQLDRKAVENILAVHTAYYEPSASRAAAAAAQRPERTLSADRNTADTGHTAADSFGAQHDERMPGAPPCLPAARAATSDAQAASSSGANDARIVQMLDTAGLDRRAQRAAERDYNTAVLAQAAQEELPDGSLEPAPDPAAAPTRKRHSTSRAEVMKRLKLLDRRP